MTPKDMEAKYSELNQLWESGNISEGQFRDRVAQLRFQGTDGTWYQIDPKGGHWLRWSGTSWEKAKGHPTAQVPEMLKSSSTTNLPQGFWLLVQLTLKKTFSSFFKRLPITILFGFGAWLLHTFLLVYVNDGYNKGKLDGYFLVLKNGEGDNISIMVIWMVLSGVIFGLFSMAFRRGPTVGLGNRLAAVAKYFRESKYDATGVMIAGAGVSLLVGAMVNGYANLVLALGFGALLASRTGSVFALLIRSAWTSIFSIARSGQVKEFSMAAGYVALVSASIGFILNSALISSPLISNGLPVGIVLLVVALVIVITERGTPTSASVILLILCGMTLWLNDAGFVFAHDGGWKEFKGDKTLFNYLESEGAIPAMLLGLGPSAGSMLGVGLVQVLFDLFNSLPEGFDADRMFQETPTPDRKPRSEPPLIDPDTGEPLVFHDGTYKEGQEGQVWYQGQWMDRSRAEQLIQDWEAQYERERRQWFDERSAEWEKDVQRRREGEGLVYDAEKDAWVPGQYHPDTIEAQRDQQAQQLNDFIDRNVKDPVRADFLENLVDRIKQNGGDLDALRQAIKDNTVGADQQRNMGDAESNLAEADAWKSSQDYATEVQKWSQRANRAIGHFAPGSGTIINMLQGGAYGTIQGYDQGGLGGALSSGAAQATDAALQKYTGVPGIGSALRKQYGTGYERDKNGNLVSPLDRMTNRVWHNLADQYDPRVYVERINKAEGLGDLVDVGLDAWDAHDDLNDLKDRLSGSDEPDVRVDTEGEGDDPGSRRPEEEAGPKPEETETMDRSRADESEGGRKHDAEEAEAGGPGLIMADEGEGGPKAIGGEVEGPSRIKSDEGDGAQRPANGEAEGGGRKPAGDDAELGGDREDRRPTRPDGQKLGDQSADGSFDLDQDNATKNSLAQYGAQIKKGDDLYQPQAETMDCTVATISKLTGQTYEQLDGNEKFSALRSDLTAEGDHQGGLKRHLLPEAIRAGGGDAEPVLGSGGKDGLKPGSEEFIRNLEDRINKGDKVAASMNDPDTGGGHAVEIKGVVSEHGITKLQIDDPRRGPLEVPVAVVEKRNLLDWENSCFVKSKETSDAPHATVDTADPLRSKSPGPIEPGGKDDLGSGYESDQLLTPSEKGEVARQQGLVVEEPVARAVVEHKQWDPVWEPKQEGGHGFDHVAKATEDGRYKVLEIKKDNATENIGNNRVLYDSDGKPMVEQVNGEWVVKKGTVYQGSRDWIWQKIHDLGNSSDPHDQQVSADLSRAMQEKKVDYVLVTANLDETNGKISTSYYESEPQPGATTGMPSDEPGRNMTQPVEGPKMNLPRDYPTGPNKKPE